ncbi:MAG: glycoside hydrolase family 3 C-terminal domain-containing protein [Lachnospiraceae bacterium]
MKSAENPFSDVLPKAKELVAQMTLEEKASLCSGKDFWTTKPIERLGIPSIMVTDGPHGLRKQAGASDHLGLNASVPATCFPTASATACSFDRNLLKEIGTAIGEECRAENVSVILGPAANMKRSPLCGRNFEYFSEDPLVSGEAAAALISGIQSKHVGTSLKHYLANNQEKSRLVSDSVIDERALHEIYLAGFETAVKKAQPWTLMCSYNQINGTYASEHKELMTDIPRKKWGFAGAIMTDWGAMNERVEAVKAGLDLEMPGGSDWNDKKIIDAVRNGELKEEALDTCAVRLTALALLAAQTSAASYDKEAHHELARRAARESAVLLKSGGALPVKRGASIAVIGEFAKIPRYQGAGSSKINPHHVTSLCEALDARNISYSYAAGYHNEDTSPDEELLREAVSVADKAELIIACVGLPDSYESEGYDRTHLRMPDSQNTLMERLCNTGVPVIAVVSTGSVIDMPWRNDVNSILLMYLAGQNIGTATADLLFGDAVPCGRLAETWPLSLEDTPSIAHFGNGGRIEYRESIYIGYRYYDKAGKDVAYPFGYGLSYTTFQYSGLTVDKTSLSDKETLTVSFTVTNTGSYAAKEIAQLYVAAPESSIFRPVRELRNFEAVFLQPGESRKVSMTLDSRAFAYYNVEIHDWFAESGSYRIEIGASSRDIRLHTSVELQNAQNAEVPDYRTAAPAYYRLTGTPFDVPKEQFEAVLGHPVAPWHPTRPFTRNSTLGELRDCAAGRNLYEQIASTMMQTMGGQSSDIAAMIQAMLEDMPLRQLAMLGGEAFSPSNLEGMLAMLNATQPDAE